MKLSRDTNLSNSAKDLSSHEGEQRSLEEHDDEKMRGTYREDTDEEDWGREMKRKREEEAGGDDGIWGKTGWAVGDKTIWPLEANGGEWSKGGGVLLWRIN
jgi:hypothetical protein